MKEDICNNRSDLVPTCRGDTRPARGSKHTLLSRENGRRISSVKFRLSSSSIVVVVVVVRVVVNK